MPNPLDTLDNAWMALPNHQKDLITALDSYDLTWLQGKNLERQNIKEGQIQTEAIFALKQFFAIKILYDPHPLTMISPVVGAAWHAFILDTQNYEAFCNRFYGRTIHHIPGGGTGKEHNLWLSMYRSLFGDFGRIWMIDFSGKEKLGYHQQLNVDRDFKNGPGDLDSDDGAYP